MCQDTTDQHYRRRDGFVAACGNMDDWRKGIVGRLELLGWGLDGSSTMAPFATKAT